VLVCCNKTTPEWRKSFGNIKLMVKLFTCFPKLARAFAWLVVMIALLYKSPDRFPVAPKRMRYYKRTTFM